MSVKYLGSMPEVFQNFTVDTLRTSIRASQN